MILRKRFVLLSVFLIFSMLLSACSGLGKAALPTATEAATHPTNTATDAPTLEPLPTVTATPIAYGCEVLSTTPEAGTKFNTNTEFTTEWTVKNTGTMAWQVGYLTLQMASGNELEKVADIYLDRFLVSGKDLTLHVDEKTPSTTGKYTITFALAMDGNTMCILPVDVEVVKP
jgi:hypothetical protein